MKKNKNCSKYLMFIKDILSNNKLFFCYLFLSLILSISFRIITIGGFPNIKGTLSDFLFSLMLGSFAYLFKEKNRFRYLLVILIFMSGLCIGNTIYYQFYRSFISVNLISTVSMIGRVNDSLWAKIHFYQFVYLLCPLLFIFIYKYLNRSNYFGREIDIKLKKNTFKIYIFIFISIFLFLSFSIVLNDLSKLSNQYNREYIVKKYGLYLYTFNDLFQSFDFNSSFDYDNLAFKFRNYYSCKSEEKKEVNSYTNIFKGKNVLFIHAESIQNFLIDLKINGEYVTPNINKFAHEGMYFKKFYPQISVGTSSDTEFTLNTGLLPSSKGTVFVNYYDTKYYSLTNYFNKLGYYTFSMHANDREYWNRDVMHKNFGYQRFYAKDDYDVSDESKYVGLGLSDESFFEQSIPLLKEIKTNHIPYYGTIITLSNHSPYRDIEHYGEFNIGIDYSYIDDDGKKVSGTRDYLDGTTMGNYLKSAHYADKAFGEFIDLLKKENLLENTIIVFYGDHESRISSDEFELLYNYDPISDKLIDKNDPSYISMDNYNYDLIKNTPLVIWSNELDLKSEIDYSMGMYDILPTMANMFGFKERYSLGNDIFSSKENIVVFPNGNVLTDKVYYSDSNEEYITFTSDPIESDYIDDLKEYANNILDISNGIIHYDLIKNEEDKLGVCNEKK